MFKAVFVVIIYLWACLCSCNHHFEALKQAKSLNPTAYTDHDEWKRVIEDFESLQHLLGTLSLLVGEQKSPSKMLKQMTNAVENFSQPLTFDSMINQVTLQKKDGITNVGDLYEDTVDKVLFQKGDLVPPGAVLFEAKKSKVAIRAPEFLRDEPYVTLDTEIKPGHMLIELQVHFCSYKNLPMQLGDVDRLIIKKLIERVEEFARMKPSKLFKAVAKVTDQQSMITVLSYVDTSIRMYAKKQSLLYENRLLRERIFWATYKSIWKLLKPTAQILSPRNFIAQMNIKSNSEIAAINAIPYVINSSSVKYFQMVDDAQWFPAASPSSLSSSGTEYRFVILGAFAQDPLAWATPGSDPYVRKVFPLEWQAAIMHLEETSDAKMNEFFRFDKFFAEQVLLPISEYNQVLTSWTNDFVQKQRRISKWVKPDSIKDLRKDFEFENYTGSNVYHYAKHWIYSTLNRIEINYGLKYARPVAFYSLQKPCKYEHNLMLPLTPQCLSMIKPRAAMKEITKEEDIWPESLINRLQIYKYKE